ncbi:MAG: tRNA threonylcarbamoyladenosine dehydratase [Eubacteriaceae bacterium]
MVHEFSRTELLIGKESLRKLKTSKVAVFGIGGVGSFVVEGLVRSGIGNFVLVDDDCICLTNLNRQIHATRKTIGKPKVEVMKGRILDINPEARVVTYQSFYMPGSANDLIKDDYDFIVDAIDTVTGKIDLIVNAKLKGIRIISAMGAGNKLDPTKFEIADIYSTSICPLAKVMRKELRKREIDSLKVVYSKEMPITPNVSEEGSCSDDYKCTSITSDKPTVRKQTPGSVSFVPSVVGLIIAGEVIKDIINH